MATGANSGAGDNGSLAYPTRQPSKWKRNVVLLLVLIVAICLAVTWKGMREEALVGTAFGARTACICRYVSGRDMDSCRGDLRMAGLRGAGRWVSLSEDTEGHAIRASVPLLARQRADFAPDRGCQLQPWQD